MTSSCDRERSGLGCHSGPGLSHCGGLVAQVPNNSVSSTNVGAGVSTPRVIWDPIFSTPCPSLLRGFSAAGVYLYPPRSCWVHFSLWAFVRPSRIEGAKAERQPSGVGPSLTSGHTLWSGSHSDMLSFPLLLLLWHSVCKSLLGIEREDGKVGRVNRSLRLPFRSGFFFQGQSLSDRRLLDHLGRLAGAVCT